MDWINLVLVPVADVNIGFLYILAVASVGAYGVILAGWASNNNYATWARCAPRRR
jgi:NADH-quinone oxidoreductase subunit H